MFLMRDAMLVQYMLSLCVCLSVRPLQVGTILRWLNTGLRKQHRSIDPRL